MKTFSQLVYTFYRGIHIQCLCLEAQNRFCSEISSKFSHPVQNKQCVPPAMSSVTRTTYLWGKHFNQLIQKPEFCDFIVESFTADIHTGLEHLQESNQHQTETVHTARREFFKTLPL